MSETKNLTFPEAAVEAAAIALDPRTMSSGGALAEKFKEQTRDEARHILEAAAPHMRAAFFLEMNLKAVREEMRETIRPHNNEGEK